MLITIDAKKFLADRDAEVKAWLETDEGIAWTAKYAVTRAELDDDLYLRVSAQFAANAD